MGSTIEVEEFKATCLQLLDMVAERHEEVTITKCGRPVARLVPVQPSGTLFGAMAESVMRQDDLVSSIDAPWEADA